MADREKVMKGLECCNAPTIRYCVVCPYLKSKIPCTRALTSDALELLKAQEPFEPEEIINDKYPVGDNKRCVGWRCGKCKGRIPWDANYCPYCGQAVKWDD